jgi:hypothetical protein
MLLFTQQSDPGVSPQCFRSPTDIKSRQFTQMSDFLKKTDIYILILYLASGSWNARTASYLRPMAMRTSPVRRS